MRFSHVIATKGRPEELARALEAFAAQAPDDAEAIVVDGDPERSAEPVVAAARERRPDRTITLLPTRPGLPHQRNVGIDAARGDVVLFTDDDCVLLPGIFEALASAYAADDVVGATGYVEDPPRGGRIGGDEFSRRRRLLVVGGRQGTMTPWGYRRPLYDRDRPHEVEWMPGSFMSARREVAREVRFDDRLEGYALGEDDDFSYRLSRRGRVLFVPEARLRHEEMGFRGSSPRAFNRRVIVNRTYLFRKNFRGTPGAWAGFVLLVIMLFGHRVLNREWDGVRGLADGLVDVLRGRTQDLVAAG